MPKAFVLEDRVMGAVRLIDKFGVLSVGRNPKCNIVTLNPCSLDPAYEDKKTIAGHVSGIHFHISYEKDGNVYVWDHKSTNGLYVRYTNGEVARVDTKTMINPGTRIYASPEYEFLLREKIDPHTQKQAEERASTDTTNISLHGDIV
jgi:pSer/pThr/pTyr-binding forkhead associated (FHA) protein